MKLGTEDKKKLRLAGVAGFFGIIAIGVIYWEIFGGTSTPPPRPPTVVTAPAAKSAPAAVATASKAVSTPPGFAVGQANSATKVGTTSAQLDPTLHMEAMLATEALVYTGSGRNIFGIGPTAMTATEIAAVKPKFTARPQTTAPQTTTVAVNPGPLPLPPIALKFFGTATSSNGTRRAFLINGDDVFLASAGDIVQRKYRVVSIAATSILIEDIPNNNKQTLPLLVN